MLSKEELDRYCREYYPLILRFCKSRLKNRSDAEDAAQETFAIFAQKCDMLEPGHIRAWLLTTAHYTVLREFQRRTLKKEFEPLSCEEAPDLIEKVRSFEDDLIDCYIDKYVDRIYERLNEKEKVLFDLYSDGNLKTGQIAQIMGLKPHACSMRKKRLIEKCREIMLEILFY